MSVVARTHPSAPGLAPPAKPVPSRREAASYCGLSDSSFARAVKRGDLPAPIHVGRRRLWKAESLDSALDRLAECSR